jgi:hypothetical protein
MATVSPSIGTHKGNANRAYHRWAWFENEFEDAVNFFRGSVIRKADVP